MQIVLSCDTVYSRTRRPIGPMSPLAPFSPLHPATGQSTGQRLLRNVPVTAGPAGSAPSEGVWVCEE